MSTALSDARPVVDGKFLRCGQQRFIVKGVAYGTFAPGAAGLHFPERERLAADFALMADTGINTVRTYTTPTEELLDEAFRHGLRVMAGVAWPQHVPFLDDRRLTREIRESIRDAVRELRGHQSLLLIALGNEIPHQIVRWHGRVKVERFLRELFDEAKGIAPDCLFTYVNYPPTEYLDLGFLDLCAFNVYLHHEADMRAYLARVQHIAGHKPLLLAEAGADSLRHGEETQGDITAMQLNAAFSEGACGAIAFTWTDDWWRGGARIEDWAFGLLDAERRPKAALDAVRQEFALAPFPIDERCRWPKVSVIVCAHNAAETLDDCLASLDRLTYPDVELILVNDGSRDATEWIARRHRDVRVITTRPVGLSAARNLGVAAARGEIVAYVDADVRVDPDWLTYLIQPFLTSDVVAAGGPNVVPADDPWLAQCVARAPGGPTHVMLDDRVAEHVPGCNMAFRRDRLLEIDGFNPIFLRAGDDVDACWRLQSRGWRIGFSPSALVWHHHRRTIRAYLRQQAGYGEGEAWLASHHPDRFRGWNAFWQGRIYSSLPFVRSLSGLRVNTGVWGSAAFPFVSRTPAPAIAVVPHTGTWQSTAIAMVAGGCLALLSPYQKTAAMVILCGLLALALTLGKCAAHALRSDIDALSPLPGRSLSISRFVYRTAITWLHFLQPLARLQGRVRGRLSTPSGGVTASRGGPDSPVRWSAPDLRATLKLLLGRDTTTRFWSESRLDPVELLNRLVGGFRTSRIAPSIETDDGWLRDRDISLAVGGWAWIDIRTLVEEHEHGRSLWRVCCRLRPTTTALIGLPLAKLVLWVLVIHAGPPWAAFALVAAAIGGLVCASAIRQALHLVVGLRTQLLKSALEAGMTPLFGEAGWPSAIAGAHRSATMVAASQS